MQSDVISRPVSYHFHVMLLLVNVMVPNELGQYSSTVLLNRVNVSPQGD